MRLPCAPRSRCKKWKVCSECNKIRQAKIADVAEIGALRSANITYAVIKPESALEFKADKSRLIKSLTRTGTSGIWTVEQGTEFDTLHMNILLGSSKEIEAEALAKHWQTANSTPVEVWAKNVNHQHVRRIAAYISKSSQIPKHEDFAGRLYGSFNGWKRPIDALASSRQGVGKALALEQQLKDAGVQARVIEASTASARDKALSRVLAVARGEIVANGFAYVEGFGVKNIKDLLDYKIITQAEAEAARAEG